MKCNLIVPGFAKCGTSSLHNYLNMHPNICMSNRKEPHYFSHDQIYSKGLGFHNVLFENADEEHVKIYGESSTSYCYDERALKRIKNDLKAPYIIVLLRNPIERLLSHYRWLWALNLEDRPLVQAVKEEDAKGYNIHCSFKGSGNYATYLRASQYSIFVPMMNEIFGQDKVLVLFSDNMKDYPDYTINKCFDFLGLNPFNINKTVLLNKTIDTRVQRTLYLDKVIRLLPRNLVYALDPKKKYRRFVLSLLGKKSRPKPLIRYHEIEIISSMLSKEIDYYNSLFYAPNYAT